jgi:hypothetical protein
MIVKIFGALARGAGLSHPLTSILVVLLLTFGGCSKIYIYQLIVPSEVKNIPADSLKWSYADGIITEVVVRNNDGEIVRLKVDDRTIFRVITTEKEEHNFLLRSLKVEDRGEGLLGSNTTWRGYDTRQGAERSVMVREVVTADIWSRIPAYSRIQIK